MLIKKWFLVLLLCWISPLFATPVLPTHTASFLSLSDLHFNPFDSCGETSPCPLVLQLKQAPVNQWATILAAHQTQFAGAGVDTNYPLLHSALGEAARQANSENVRFVVILGDYLAHDYQENYIHYSGDTTEQGYQAFVKKTLEFLTQQLTIAFNKQHVFMAIGNNDSYAGDYLPQPAGQFYQDVFPLWSRLIKDAPTQNHIHQVFLRAGYYAADIPNQSKLKLIVLNSVLFSSKAPAEVAPAAVEELTWLQEELEHARLRNQKVLIIEHIPAGVDVFSSVRRSDNSTAVEFWKPEYTARFLTEVSSYSDQILGVLGGHIHMDYAQVVNNILVSGTPAISPRFGNRPAFKIYQYSFSVNGGEVHSLSDFSTYFYSADSTPGWRKEYSFQTTYQPACQTCALAQGISLIQPQGDLADHYIQYYAVGTQSQPITTSNKWMPYYWCSIQNMTAAAYQACITQT